MAHELDAVMDKVARLKTLAERPGTPEEAAAAVSAIQRLMTKYNLTQMQVNAASRNTERGFDRFEIDLGAKLQWRQVLLNAICEYGYCKFVFSSANSRNGFIVGEQHNVVVAKELYAYLVAEIYRLADVGWDNIVQWGMSKAKWCHSFRVGAAFAVAERIKQDFLADQQRQEASTSALVVVYEDDLNNAMARFFPRMGAGRKRITVADAHGYGRGQAAGKKINLAKQIGK